MLRELRASKHRSNAYNGTLIQSKTVIRKAERLIRTVSQTKISSLAPSASEMDPSNPVTRSDLPQGHPRRRFAETVVKHAEVTTSEHLEVTHYQNHTIVINGLPDELLIYIFSAIAETAFAAHASHRQGKPSVLQSGRLDGGLPDVSSLREARHLQQQRQVRSSRASGERLPRAPRCFCG